MLARKNIVFSAKRYGIDALGAMAQGLFASLLIGTIISTLGQQIGIPFLETAGGYAKAVSGPAMAISIGYALQVPQLVLFSLLAVGQAANELGGAGGPLAVLVVAIFASEFGKAVSKETKIDILVTPLVTILVGVILSVWWAPSIGAAASAVGGTCGLVGQIGVYTGWLSDIAAGTKDSITAMDWIGLVLICFILPAVLSTIFCEILRKMGWIKKGDLTLE